MTWGGQVRAVFVKDLRQTWWVLALLGALILITVVRMTESQPTGLDVLGWYSFFIPLLMVLALAFVVRADPPAVSTAFWTTQPLETSAVATAKLLHPVVLTMMMMVGAAAALRWGHVALAKWSPLGVVVAIGLLTLCVTILTMTVTASFRWSAPLTALYTLAVWMLLPFLTSQWDLPDGPLAGSLMLGMSIATGVLLLLGMYRAREASAPLFDGIIGLVTKPVTDGYESIGATAVAHSPSRSSMGAMSWAAQVRHFFVRAMAETQATLAVASVMLAVVVTRTVLGKVDDFFFELLSDLGLRLAFLFHLASVVHVNPPPYLKSFWATQPQYPSAVATATLLHSLLVLVIILTATLIVQSAWHFSGTQQWMDLVPLLTCFTALVLPVVVMSTLYIEVSALRVLPAWMFASLGNFPNFQSETAIDLVLTRAADFLTIWAWLPATAGLVGLLLWRYRHAELPGGAATGFVFVIFVHVPFLLLVRGSGPAHPRVADASPVPPLSMTVVPDSDYIRFELHAPDGLPGDAYRLVNWALIVTLKDGSTTRLDGIGQVLPRSDGRTANVRLRGDSLAVIGGKSLRMTDSAGFRHHVGSRGRITPDEVAGMVAARLEGTIESYRMTEVDRLPLRNGLAFLRNGRRAAMTILTPDASGLRISLRTKWLGHSVERHAAWPVGISMDSRHLGFALINTSRSTMLPLRSAEDGWVGTSRQQLGFGVSGYDYTLRPAIWTLPIPPVDSAWLAGAELVVGTPVLTNAVRISVTGIVEQPAPRRTRRSG